MTSAESTKSQAGSKISRKVSSFSVSNPGRAFSACLRHTESHARRWFYVTERATTWDCHDGSNHGLGGETTRGRGGVAGQTPGRTRRFNILESGRADSVGKGNPQIISRGRCSGVVSHHVGHDSGADTLTPRHCVWVAKQTSAPGQAPATQRRRSSHTLTPHPTDWRRYAKGKEATGS